MNSTNQRGCALSRAYASLALMGAATIYGWASALGPFSPESQGESLWGVIVPLLMALLWRQFESRTFRSVFALGCTIVGVAATLSALYAGNGALAALGANLRLIIHAAYLLLWCWLYGRMPIAKSAFVFGGMQACSFLIAITLLLLPIEVRPGLALAMPIFCLGLFEQAQREVDEQPVQKESEMRAPNIGRDLRWRLLAAAFTGAFAFGLAKASSGGLANVASFGCSGALLLGAATLFRKRVSTQSIFNFALPLIVAGLALGAIAGDGLPQLSSLLTGVGYALMMALFTIVLADRSFRFGVPAIWSIGIVRAALSAGRYLGTATTQGAAQLPLPESAVAVVAMLAVLVAAIAWIQDSFSLTKEALGVNESAPIEGDSGATFETRATNASGDQADAIKQQLLIRCEEVGNEYLLSAREKEVLECLAFGWSVPRIEEKLVISNSTAKTHVRHIYSKLGIHSRDELKILLGVDAF